MKNATGIQGYKVQIRKARMSLLFASHTECVAVVLYKI